MWWIVVIVSIGAIPLASHMAHARGRSPRAWAWTAVIIGPLAPLVLVILGKADDEHPAPAN